MRDLGEDPRPARGAVREVYDVARAATIDYSPDLDGFADPGEIVWAWVPYEEDPDRGKDRPRLEIGPGRWDQDNRVSYLRLDRIFELDEDDIRREGSVLDRERFARVATVL